MKHKKTKTAEEAILKLDLACGRNKQPGFYGVDLYSPEADLKLDLLKFPWPWKDGSVSEIHCSHYVEHIPANLRCRFFEECWRVMKMDGIMRVFTPSHKSERAYGDQSHCWPPVVAFFYLYLNKNWREANRLNYGYYDLRCNWDHQCGPTNISQDFASRNHETQMFALRHYNETYDDMWAVLTKRPL